MQIELDLYCDLTPRQKAMYRTLKENISITDLVARASNLNDDDSVKRLMNLIMQFRKVCNHPELFERADVTAPLAFATFNKTASLIRDPEVLDVPYATHSVIEYQLPKTVYREGGLLHVAGPKSRAGSDSLHLARLMNIWQPDYIQRSLHTQGESLPFNRRPCTCPYPQRPIPIQIHRFNSLGTLVSVRASYTARSLRTGSCGSAFRSHDSGPC